MRECIAGLHFGLHSKNDAFGLHLGAIDHKNQALARIVRYLPIMHLRALRTLAMHYLGTVNPLVGGSNPSRGAIKYK
jgi:hypothetical protein